MQMKHTLTGVVTNDVPKFVSTDSLFFSLLSVCLCPPAININCYNSNSNTIKIVIVIVIVIVVLRSTINII